MIVICPFLADKQVKEAVFQVQNKLGCLCYGGVYILSHYPFGAGIIFLILAQPVYIM